jgi:hypothetical protein
MGEVEVKRGVEARVEMGHEEVVFVTSDGQRHSVSMREIVENGTPDQMLVYAQLVLLQAIHQQQGSLAQAMTNLAEAMRALTSGASAQDPQETAKTAVSTLLSTLKAAGIPLPAIPPGVVDGDRS